MPKIIRILVILLISWLNAGGMESYIVVDHGDEVDSMQDIRSRLEQTVQKEITLHNLLAKTQAVIALEKMADMYMVQLGPFDPDKQFAMIYLMVHAHFPQAIVIERAKPAPAAPPAPPPLVNGATSNATSVATPPQYVSETNREETSTDNTTIWIALFGLAVIGILYMFLSSDQLRRIKKEHVDIEERQKKLEVKQHTLLAQMGENIHTLAKETATRTQTLAQKTEGVLLHDDVQKVIDGENELLGITSDLIKFLQIKSKKIAIQNAPFDFNNVLHEVAGTLYSTCKSSGKELVFDVDKNVPKEMHADSLHMAQVLTNLIEFLMCHTVSHKVHLRAGIRMGSDNIQILHVEIHSEIGAIDEEMFFDAYYDEASKKYVGLGLFVARELVQLMGGELTLGGEAEANTRLALTFPVGKRSEDRRQYRLPDRAIMDEKVLIVDKNRDVTYALKHFLDYFKMDATVMSSDTFMQRMPDFSHYDIVAIDNTLFDKNVVHFLREKRNKDALQVISLENLYASHTIPVDDVADVRMKKPLTQQHVFDILVQLGRQESMDPVDEAVAHELDADSLEVFRGDFADNRSIALEDFSRFSGAHVMIVEDNLVNQKVLKGMLSKAGLKLTIANNGQEALDLLEEVGEEVEMILMDISMPIMDGFTATKRIHEDSRFKKIPIVTLTALVSEHEVDKMFDVGANGYLSKPLKIGKLFSAMEKFLKHIKVTPDALQSNTQERNLPKIDGLDIRHAIGNMQNNALLYREVLSEFKEFYGSSDAVFEKLIQDTRYEQLRTLCVDLRGLSGSIGAKGLFEVVTEAQTMLVYKKYSLLERLIEPYRTELEKLNRAIEQYLG
jgi:CheY-like chemotaxis protein